MLDKFYDYLRYELNRAPLTVTAYKNDLQQFCSWLNPNSPEEIDFKSITASDIRAWLGYLSKHSVTPRSIRRKVISLRILFKWLHKSGYISHSPLIDVSLPKISKPLPDVIKPNEIEQALANLEKIEEKSATMKQMKILIVDMLYSLGIRKAELVGLNDGDISFSKAEIKVTGKRMKQRVIPVPEKLLDKIKKWQSARNHDWEPPADGDPLFYFKGKRISHNKVYLIVKEALSDSSARKKSPHALRHSFASGMLNGGAEIDSVREFLGHASLATTQIYTHVSLKEIKKAYSAAHPRSDRNFIDKKI